MRSAIIHAVGDIMFDITLPPPRVFFHRPDVAACLDDYQPGFKVVYMNTPESRTWLAERNQYLFGIAATSHLTTSRPLSQLPDPMQHDFPFDMIRDELRKADVVFGNLECPLSERGRRCANDVCYRASPGFAAAIARAGFDIVSLANNHIFDYGEPAFLDTLASLRENGVAIVGAGENAAAARAPVMVAVGDLNVASLAYSMIGRDWIYATDTESGIAPLNPMVVAQDVARARGGADVVLVSVHWGVEYQPVPCPRQRQLARELIDAGADVILGHHPHVPGSIELYRGRPIFYSLGNFLFGHDHAAWNRNNMIASIEIEDGRVARAAVTPIGGVYQPRLLDEDAAWRFHEHLGAISAEFGTAFQWKEGRSVIELA